jgi:homoaconitase/3-isopropylmalate dehydratase large subunit
MKIFVTTCTDGRHAQMDAVAWVMKGTREEMGISLAFTTER